jgi:hypothetical protein
MSFLESLFGPSKNEIWKQFSDAIGGNFTEEDYWKAGKVEATHGNWLVTLDTYTVSTGKSSMTYTRIRAPYTNPDGFQFRIYRRGIFSNLGKLLGMQDVTVGYPAFDDEFIIQGNDEAKLRRLFANKKIRDLIDRQPDVQFSVQDNEQSFWGDRKFPVGVDELYFLAGGIIRDGERLKLLYDLFSETLDELCRIGSASETNPGVKL